MADSRHGARNTQDDPEGSNLPESKEESKKKQKNEDLSEEQKDQLKELPMAHFE